MTADKSDYQRKPTPLQDERGIYWNRGKWVVALIANGTRYYGGRFVLKREAIRARDALRVTIKEQSK
jgi:hypothetical protein